MENRLGAGAQLEVRVNKCSAESASRFQRSSVFYELTRTSNCTRNTLAKKENAEKYIHILRRFHATTLLLNQNFRHTLH
jgi:hypothetical protein